MTDLCRQFDTLIARAAQLPEDEAARLDAHLAGCRSCRELARVMKPVSEVAFEVTSASETVADTQNTATQPRHPHELPAFATERYRVTGEVGRGGIGRVLQARDQVLDRPVALKELFSASEATRSRFVREALITARLQHPSIVPIYDAGRLGERSPFYAMKLVAGRPLDKAIASATTLAQRLALLPSVLAIADAMAYAHSQRIIHRDLKPQNVLVGTFGETVVIDWGLAKDLAIDDRDALEAGPYRAETTHDQTVAGVVLGTPAYMAPEQAAGEPVDERADVYAIGAILYHVVSGAIPHEGTTFEELVHRVIAGDVRPLTEREPDVPRDLAAIVSKAMAVDPAERYANAQGLADDLRRYLTGQLVASHTYGTRELVRRWLKRHRAAVSVALAALVLVGIVGAVSVARIVRAREDADAAAATAKQERADAEKQKTTATEMVAELLTEQGRQELLAGRPARAVVYLSEAQARSAAPSVALRSLLADAMPALDALLSLEGHTAALSAATFSHDGLRIATASSDHTIKIWDSVTGAALTTLRGHTEPIGVVQFSPDDARILTASVDKTARLWDVRTGKLLATFTQPDIVTDAAFSPDGAHVVIASVAGAVTLWDAKTGQQVATFAGHRELVYSVAYSADGTRVVTASADRAAKIWDAKTGKLVRSLDGHGDQVYSAAFSPDGSRVVTASKDTTARLWDARTGKLLKALAAHTAGVVDAVFSRDGARIVTASEDRTAKVWDAEGNFVTSLDGHTARVTSVAFSPDGTRVITSSADHTAKLWDARTGRPLAAFEAHREAVWFATFSPAGTEILTLSADGTAKLWDAAPSKVRAALAIGGTARMTSGAFSPDGARIVTTAEGDHAATLWETRTGKRVASLDGHRDEITFAAFDRAGTRIATASNDHTAKLWDAKTGALVASLDHDEADVLRARFTPDGSRLVTTSYDNHLRIWNAKTGALIVNIEAHSAEIFELDMTADGGRVVTASADETAKIWRTDTGALVAQLAGHTNSVYAAVFSSDGQRVVTAGSDYTAKLWDARTGKLVATLEHAGKVHAARFSADGARIVTASGDHSAKLWDGRTGKLVGVLDGHTDEVLDATFSPDPEGARVVTASADHTAKLWDARTGKLLRSLDGHTKGVFAAAFSADGARVMTTGDDGTIAIWDVHLEARPREAIQRIVSARAPWVLSNSRLVPVAPAFKSAAR